MRLGLCCTFRDAPIRFQTTTAAAMARLEPFEAQDRLQAKILSNIAALSEALDFCARLGIGSFRILSQLLPLKTHPRLGYDLQDMPQGEECIKALRRCGRQARQLGLRTGFHPDQFVVLNSTRPEVVDASLREIEDQAVLAEWVGADTINIHGGGAYGDKPRALDTLRRNLDRLSPRARRRITLENDDSIFTPSDLLPICRAARVPLVYDVHHHRCHPDGLSEEEAFAAAVETWNREPLVHISSPLEGWQGPRPERHHDFIDPADFPMMWRDAPITVEVEAKAKEVAVLKLAAALGRHVEPS